MSWSRGQEPAQLRLLIPHIRILWLGYFGENRLQLAENYFSITKTKDFSHCLQEPTTGLYLQAAKSSPLAVTKIY
jgi:hypothetical protein